MKGFCKLWESEAGALFEGFCYGFAVYHFHDGLLGISKLCQKSMYVRLALHDQNRMGESRV